MSKPRLLDLFCGAGGAAMGYSRAGFDVVGVDIEPQPHYPFEFIQADWTTMAAQANAFTFDAIHASPPCQRYSAMSNCKPGLAETYPDLVDPVRQFLITSGLPWVIENVVGAPLRGDFILCGCMFGMRTRRPRLFETSWGNTEMNMPHNHTRLAMNPQNRVGQRRITEEFGDVPTHVPWINDLGVGWMSRAEARESIPPVFTEFIGKQLMSYLSRTTPKGDQE